MLLLLASLLTYAHASFARLTSPSSSVSLTVAREDFQNRPDATRLHRSNTSFDFYYLLECLHGLVQDSPRLQPNSKKSRMCTVMQVMHI